MQSSNVFAGASDQNSALWHFYQSVQRTFAGRLRAAHFFTSSGHPNYKNFLSYVPEFCMVGYRQMHGITVYVHAAPLPASRFYSQANKHVPALPNTERFHSIIIDDDTKVLAN
ncbi:hypothetical protein [Pantoea dispersa]|uniref:hypothetical protein n=1 Tax=Pantoea dispersa TaxID=59814 RepID=UPI00285FB548|nr:hypothetical protein [Pantoea dispersa]MDR6295018.1 hypothetical protein [Pantoea dispersa]